MKFSFIDFVIAEIEADRCSWSEVTKHVFSLGYNERYFIDGLDTWHVHIGMSFFLMIEYPILNRNNIEVPLTYKEKKRLYRAFEQGYKRFKRKQKQEAQAARWFGLGTNC